MNMIRLDMYILCMCKYIYTHRFIYHIAHQHVYFFLPGCLKVAPGDLDTFWHPKGAWGKGGLVNYSL